MFLQILKYYSQQALAYPSETFFVIIRKAIGLFFRGTFWVFLVKDQNMFMSIYLPYLLISSGLSDLFAIPGRTSYSVGKVVRKSIKSGEFSNYILLPTNLLVYLYGKSTGQNIVLIIVAIIQLGVGFILIPHIEVTTLGLFVLFAIIAFILAIAFNLLEASLAFFFTEAKGIKNAIRHIYSVFSGELIPLNLLPANWQFLLLFSPFSFMNYWPVAIITNIKIQPPVNLLNTLITGMLWTLIISLSVIFLWKKGIKEYEAIGL